VDTPYLPIGALAGTFVMLLWRALPWLMIIFGLIVTFRWLTGKRKKK
jgi:uncharacterized BrkB/YihY/UPF0761 family membrane protein